MYSSNVQLMRLLLVVGAAFATGCIGFASASDGRFRTRVTVRTESRYYLYSDIDEPPGIGTLPNSAEQYSDSEIRSILSYSPEGKFGAQRALIISRNWVWEPTLQSRIAGHAGQSGQFRSTTLPLPVGQELLRVFRSASIEYEEPRRVSSEYDLVIYADAVASTSYDGQGAIDTCLPIVSGLTLMTIPAPVKNYVIGYRIVTKDRQGRMLCENAIAIRRTDWISWLFLLAPWWVEFSSPPLLPPETAASVFAYLIENCEASNDSQNR